MSVRILEGDALTVLATLPDESVQCCVTSPPYFGLRDYQVAGQLGLEKTPAEYVEKMVAVFREVRRVLRDDGTLWLNIGSSYAAAGDTAPIQVRRGRSAPAYGTDGKALQGSHDPGSSCSDLCDGCRAALLQRTARSDRPTEQSPSPSERIGRGIELTGSAQVSQAAALPSALASTTPESSPQPPGECSHCSNCGACLSVMRSTLRDSRLCARRSACNGDRAEIQRLSGVHIEDKEPSFSAYSNITSLRFKSKDLIPIPWMLATALQQDGWYLRQDIIWAKPNPMPESVTDRCTKSHEYVFLLTKSSRYYFDTDAIAEPAERGAAGSRFDAGKTAMHQLGRASDITRIDSPTRNKRSVWTVTTQPFKEAHFATMPPKLVEPCVLAGTSRQACEKCGAPWERDVDRKLVNTEGWGRAQKDHHGAVQGSDAITRNGQGRAGDSVTVTLGWSPTCDCENSGTGTCTVLDPFTGAGTTGLVANRLGRSFVGVELNPKYAEMARGRIHNDAPLFSEEPAA